MKSRFFVVLFVSSIVGCVSSQKAREERAILHLQIGTGYLAQGMYPQAISELLKAEQLDSRNASVANNLGLAYHIRGRVRQAENKFRQAIKIDPHFSDAKNNLARNLSDQRRFEEALLLLHEVEGDLTYPNPEKTYTNLGMAYFEQGVYSKAESYLLRALEVRRENCTAANYYGRTLQQQNQFRQAAASLDQAIEFCRSVRFEEPIFFSAMSYFSLGEKEKSRARLEELLKNYPQSKYVVKAKGMLKLLEQ